MKLDANDVAVVGSRHVTVAMYEQGLAQERAELEESGDAVPKAGTSEYQAMKSGVVDALVDQGELAIEATKLGVKVTPSEVQAQVAALKKKYFGGSEAQYEVALEQQDLTDADVRANLQVSLLQDKIAAALTKNVTVTAAQVAAYYAKHVSHYTQPETRKVREILAGKNNEKLADRIYAQLKTGASFATLARRYSQDPGSKNSGGLFTATKGQDVPEFDNAVFAASSKTGQLLRPVDTAAYGWFVIQPLAPIVPAKTTPESKVASAIRKTLMANQKQTILNSWEKAVLKSFCSDGQISYQAGYTPSPNPCTSTSTKQTTT